MPAVTKNLLIINVLVFAASIVAGRYNIDLNDLFGLHFFLANSFNPLQLVSYMFLHAGVEHLFFNMFAVWMFGRIIEQTFGPKRFLLYYMVCGIGAGLLQELVQYISYLSQGLDAYDHVMMGDMLMDTGDYLNRWTTVGASGAVYGILLAFGMTYPEERMFIFPLPVPIKAKFFVMGYAVIELLSALMRSTDGVAHFAHLGGMLFGLLLILHWRRNRGGGMPWDSWIENLRRRFTRRKRGPYYNGHEGQFADEMDYNRRWKERSEEIDRILDKVKKHGYGCLSEDEKRKLFDASAR